MLGAPFGFGRSLRGKLRRGKSGHHKAARPLKGGAPRSQRRGDGQCHRKQTARKGKGEKVG